MKKELIVEINRMKEIMGLSLLTEDYGDIVKKLFGLSDESANSIKNVADQTDEFSNAIKQVVGGTGSYSDLLGYVGRKYSKSSPTVDDIVAFIKTQPDVLKKMALSSDAVMKKAAEDLFATSSVKSLFTTQSWDYVDDLIKMELEPDFIDSSIRYLDDALANLKPHKGRGNTELDDLIKQLEERKSLADKLKTDLEAPVSPIGGAADEISSEADDIYNSLISTLGRSIDESGTAVNPEDYVKNYVDTLVSKKLISLPSGVSKETIYDEVLAQMKKVSDNFEAIQKAFDKFTPTERAKFVNRHIENLKSLKATVESGKGPSWFKKFLGKKIDEGIEVAEKGSKIDVKSFGIGVMKWWILIGGLTSVTCLSYEAYKSQEDVDEFKFGDATDCLKYLLTWPIQAVSSAIEYATSGGEGSKTASDAYNAIVANDENLEGLTIDEKTWKLESSDNGVEIYNANMSDGSSYTFQWDGNVWTIL